MRVAASTARLSNKEPTVTKFLFDNWRKISTGLLLATVLGAGGVKVHQMMTGDCCQPGSPCCYPGSPCCHHGDSVAMK